MPSTSWIQQLPPTSGISDPQVRAYLDAFTNAWKLRNGDVGVNDSQRFVTKGEIGTMVKDAIAGTFSSAAGGGPGTSPGTRGQGSYNDIATSIANSVLYSMLGTVIPEIRPPYERLAEIDKIIGDAMSGITVLKNKVTRVTEESAESVRDVRVLNTAVGQYDSLIFDSVQTSAGRAERVSTMKAAFGSIEAAITNINTVTASSTSAAARALFAMTATMGLSIRTFFNLATAGGVPIYTSASDAMRTPRVNDQWFSPTAFGGQVAYTRRVWNGSAWVVSSLVDATEPYAGILHEVDVRVARDTANASAINNMWAAVTGNVAQIQDGATTIATNDTSFSQKWTTLQADIYDAGTGVTQVYKLRQDMFVGVPPEGSFEGWPGINNMDALRGGYVLRMENNGRVSGFGMVMTDTGDATNTTLSSFGVLADQFWIAPPGWTGPPTDALIPFAVVDGQVYIKDAVIGNIIQSDNFVAGTSGWQINRNGTAEFDAVVLRSQTIAPVLSQQLQLLGSGTLNVTWDGEQTNFAPTYVAHGLGRMPVAVVATGPCVVGGISSSEITLLPVTLPGQVASYSNNAYQVWGM